MKDKQNSEERVIKTIKSNIIDERNPFRYDSSDDEGDNDISQKHENLVNTASKDAPEENARQFWIETFFFKEDDYRLQGIYNMFND